MARVIWMVVGCICALACSTPQTGGNSGTEGSSESCLEPVEVALSEAADPFDFSAADMLELANQEQDATLRWLAVDSGPMLPDAETTLSVSVEASGVATVYRCANADAPGAADSHLELPVTVTMSTGDGLLNEAFDATLTAKSASTATIEGIEIRAAEIAGTLGDDIRRIYSSGARDLLIDMAFTAEGPKGSVSGPISPLSARPCGFAGTYAVWGLADCAPEVDSATAEMYANLVSGTYSIRWNDDETTTAELSVSPQAGAACNLAVSLTLTSADGRMAIAVDGHLSPSGTSAVEAWSVAAIDAQAAQAAMPLSTIVEEAVLVNVVVGSSDIDEEPLSGSIVITEVDREGFATPLPAGALPPGASLAHCFDASDEQRSPILEGSLTSE